MFTRLGHLTVRRRRLVLALTGAFAVLAAVLGTGVFGALGTQGFDDPSSDSSRAAALLEERFGAAEPNLVLLVDAGPAGVDAALAAAAGADLTSRLAATPGVTQVVSYWSLGNAPALRSNAGDKALVVGSIAGSDTERAERLEAVRALAEDVSAGPVDVQVGGQEAVFDDVGHTVEQDLQRAETIAVPITLVLLVVVFGSLVAAGLPLLVGVVAVLGTFLSLFLIAQVTNVSIYSINLTTALGLGLAIDYSLFVVSRFREELRAGSAPHDAVVRTVERAGRTVAFSALTVAVSLSALLVFPLYFLRSFAYAGIAVVLVAAVASVVSLPSLLAVLGHRVDRGRVLRRAEPVAGESGFWHRVATAVMRRPVPVALAVTALLLVLGLPFLRVAFGLSDDRALPAGAPSRVVSEQLRADFPSQEANAFEIVVPSPVDDVAVARYAAEVSAVPGVVRVDARTGHYAGGRLVAPADATSLRFGAEQGTWLSVVPGVEPVSGDGERLVRSVRAVDPGFETLVGGRAAALVDTKAAIAERLPWAALVIVVATFVLLFLMFGSLLVPAKALVLNLLSLSATFGAMVWIFQDGNGAGLLGFTPTGTLDVSMPILMFCIAFGLSMDYEVFLLSRIKEEYDRTGDNTRAVAMGLERTGRIVTAAAALLAVTFLAFATSGVTFLKLFGLGLALAVVMDATVVRATLVPAFMKLAGRANWWAPAPLRRLHERFGISEHVAGDDTDPGAPDGVPVPAGITA
jgi:RND superfamily putative drug exporter